MRFVPHSKPTIHIRYVMEDGLQRMVLVLASSIPDAIKQIDPKFTVLEAKVSVYDAVLVPHE